MDTTDKKKEQIILVYTLVLNMRKRLGLSTEYTIEEWSISCF
jgi:hypothetical protein